MSETVSLRLDKWLWHARFIRARDSAAELIGQRRVRINDLLVAKTHHKVRPGDVVTLREEDRLRVLRVLELGRRRGPATEAQSLYAELLSEA